MRLILLRAVTSEACQNFIAELQCFFGVTQKGPTNILVDWYFTLASSFGDEIFYSAILPIVMWYIDFSAARKLFLAWMVMLFIGQCLKDFLKLPRPRDFTPPVSPTRKPVVSLEKTYENEFGMPSTHTMAGLLPFYTCFCLDPTLLNDSRVFCVCTIYSLSVAISRLYKGVHSVADVTVGFVVGIIILIILCSVNDDIDQALTYSPNGLLLLVTGVLLAFILYPFPDPWSSSVGFTAIISGAASGLLASSWLVYHVDWMKPIDGLLVSSRLSIHSSASQIKVAIAEYLIGMIMVLLIGFSARFIFDQLVPVGRSLSGKYWREIFSKFVKYGSMGFGVVISPLVWQKMKLIQD